MRPAKCVLRGHDYTPLYARLNNDPEAPIEGVMNVCKYCGSQKPVQGLLRKGAKLFNEKGQWLGSVEKAAVV